MSLFSKVRVTVQGGEPIATSTRAGRAAGCAEGLAAGTFGLRRSVCEPQDHVLKDVFASGWYGFSRAFVEVDVEDTGNYKALEQDTQLAALGGRTSGPVGTCVLPALVEERIVRRSAALK